MWTSLSLFLDTLNFNGPLPAAKFTYNESSFQQKLPSGLYLLTQARWKAAQEDSAGAALRGSHATEAGPLREG